MKIPALNLGAPPATSGLGRTVDRVVSSSPSFDSNATLRPAAIDRIEVNTGETTDKVGQSPEERLAHLASHFETRLDNLMERDGMSEEKVAALGQAKEDFQGLVDRLSNALDSLKPGGAARGFRIVVNDLVENVQAAVSEEVGSNHPGTNTDGNPNTDIGPGDQNADVDNMNHDPVEGLVAMQARFQTRFESFFKQEGLDARLVRELGAAKEGFDGVLERLHNAYDKGSKDVSFLRSGFTTALAGLTEDLESAFAKEHQLGKPDSNLHPDVVALYGSNGTSTPLVPLQPSNVDQIV